jgi:hypothetical protein
MRSLLIMPAAGDHGIDDRLSPMAEDGVFFFGKVIRQAKGRARSSGRRLRTRTARWRN